MFKRFVDFLKRKNQKLNSISDIERFLVSGRTSPKVNLGQLQAHFNNQKPVITNLSEVEFQVFSQYGDDGIIQYLINKLDIPNKTFIEFGVENYTESNTRFLLVNNNWTGYVIDGSAENIRYIKNDGISWACELYAECAFITRENIKELITKPGFEKEVGILSIDIDGNDYWIWKEIDNISPIIVIVEYNSVFGVNTSWTVPYQPDFVRTAKHSSNLYYGVSLKALVGLANEKGYDFIGCNSKGNNSYFIRRDKLGSFLPKSVEEGYSLSKFREANINGQWITGTNRIKLIQGLPILNLETGKEEAINPANVLYR